MTKVTLVEFLLARIAEDEINACAATPGPWDSSGWVYGNAATESYGVWAGAINTQTPRPPIVKSSRYQQGYYDAQHIARHDPARVLADCAAKRRIVEECAPNVAKDWPFPDGLNLSEFVVAELVQPYSSHPDYRDEWRALR